jgi:hypothetical protein
MSFDTLVKELARGSMFQKGLVFEYKDILSERHDKNTNEPTLKSKIIDFSDCTTTDFRAAMAMEFYSIKCQFLIRT